LVFKDANIGGTGGDCQVKINKILKDILIKFYFFEVIPKTRVGL